MKTERLYSRRMVLPVKRLADQKVQRVEAITSTQKPKPRLKHEELYELNRKVPISLNKD